MARQHLLWWPNSWSFICGSSIDCGVMMERDVIQISDDYKCVVEEMAAGNKESIYRRIAQISFLHTCANRADLAASFSDLLSEAKKHVINCQLGLYHK